MGKKLEDVIAVLDEAKAKIEALPEEPSGSDDVEALKKKIEDLTAESAAKDEVIAAKSAELDSSNSLLKEVDAGTKSAAQAVEALLANLKAQDEKIPD